MQWPAEYLYLRDEYGDHYYKPENCEQPLIYILLFLIGISQQKVQNGLSNLWATFLKQPNRDILEACKDSLLEKKNENMKEGFGILQDPTGILE